MAFVRWWVEDTPPQILQTLMKFSSNDRSEYMRAVLDSTHGTDHGLVPRQRTLWRRHAATIQRAAKRVLAELQTVQPAS